MHYLWMKVPVIAKTLQLSLFTTQISNIVSHINYLKADVFLIENSIKRRDPAGIKRGREALSCPLVRLKHRPLGPPFQKDSCWKMDSPKMTPLNIKFEKRQRQKCSSARYLDLLARKSESTSTAKKHFEKVPHAGTEVSSLHV